MNERLSISVIIPLYNGARYIESTLSSVAAQTALVRGEVDLEVIVVDDGSTDNGPQLAVAHQVQPRMIHQDHRGVAAARNRGAAAARGEWLSFLDQDDLWHESRVEAVAPILLSQRASFVLTRERSFASESEQAELQRLTGYAAHHLIANESDAVRLWEADIQPDAAFAEEERFSASDLMRQTIAMSTSFFITAEHLRLIGGWSLHARSIDDWWLMVNAVRLEPILRVNQPTLLYRLHTGATSRTTKFVFPLATSLLALRFGGQVEDLKSALTKNTDNQPVEHLVLQLIRSPVVANAGVMRYLWHMCHLLWPEKRWLPVFAKSWVRRKLPSLIGPKR